MNTKQTEAVRMAEALEGNEPPAWPSRPAAAELRRLHADNKYPPYMLAAIALVGLENIAHLFPKPKPPRIFTSADEERKVKAMEKRERKAAKREQEAQMPVDPAAGQSLRAMRFFNRHERAKP